MNRKKDIIRMINSMAGKYSAYEVFSDWVKCSALAVSQSCRLFHDSIWEEREQIYMDTMKKYSEKERELLQEMFILLAETLESGMSDVLGEIYMESGMGSKAAGQFFTPYHIGRLTAQMGMQIADGKKKYVIREPSCGGGGMIIACAQALMERGLNYQKCMEVIAQDLDWKSIYMCYLQLSLLGIDAVCIQGDSLREVDIMRVTDERHMLRTPARMGALL